MERSEPLPGQVVLLNGPPSCGKTTLARALRGLLPRPYFHLSLDDFRSGYEQEVWQHDDGHMFQRVMVGYLGALREMALAGNHVIAEAIVTPDRLVLYLDAFAGLSVIFVGVRCPLDVAVARESKRSDRMKGPVDLPEDAFNAVHAHGTYDLEVDTSTRSATDIATDIASALPNLVPSAFERLRHARRP